MTVQRVSNSLGTVKMFSAEHQEGDVYVRVLDYTKKKAKQRLLKRLLEYGIKL